MNTMVLVETLRLAVPLHMAALAEHHPNMRDSIRQRWVELATGQVGSRGDALQFGGKRGEAAEVFNHLARGLAALAYQPGGVTFNGVHWCVDHAACLDAARQAAELPWPADNPQPEPAEPTLYGRTLVDVPLPEVA